MITLLTILGALGIFLYGMKVMSEGIQKVAGNGMRTALATMTKNRFSAALTGLFTTGLVQSSSATTVMVVSFVNVGLLTLTESIGVIMGANLGTTVTAWIVATIGKFSVTKIALPIIGIGLPLFFAGKNKWKYIGEVLIGFGLLFFGLGELKAAVPDLKGAVKAGDAGTIETLRGIVSWIQGTGFASVILFMLAGVALTLVVQSSSAAMAITITFAMQGWLGDDPVVAFQNSAAIVLGENIGTTVTAWLASIGATVHAKRAARAHLIFNVIGVLWMLIIFTPFTHMVWSLADSLPEDLKSAKKDFGKSEVAFATAVFHTSFNLINIFILIWFVPQIAKLVKRMIKNDEKSTESHRLQYLTQSLVDMGQLNLAEAEKATKTLSDTTAQMFSILHKSLLHPERQISNEIPRLKSMEREVDSMVHDLTEYLVHCSTKEMDSQTAQQISCMLRITATFEDYADTIFHLAKLLERKSKTNDTPLSGNLFQEYLELLQELITRSHQHTFTPLKASALSHLAQLKEQSNTLRQELNSIAMTRIIDTSVPAEMLNIKIHNQLHQLTRHALRISEECCDKQH